MTSEMDKANSFGRTGPVTKVNGKLEEWMGKELSLMRMGTNIQVNGLKTESMEKELSSIQVALNTLETGLLTKKKAKGKILGQMVLHMKVAIPKVVNMVTVS